MRRQHPRVTINKSGDKITLKKFKKNATKLLIEDSVTKKEIISSKIFTEEEFKAFIAKYKIPVTTKNHTDYINRDLFLKYYTKYKKQ